MFFRTVLMRNRNSRTSVVPARFGDAVVRVPERCRGGVAGRAWHGGKLGVNISLRSKAMLNQQFTDEISAKVREILANSPARDIETNMRAMLAAMFARLDLVTRHEFDVQTELLARTREKLTALEAKLAELEAKRKA
jgi:hypothetical protein